MVSVTVHVDDDDDGDNNNKSMSHELCMFFRLLKQPGGAGG